jgi:hypothetical protein
LKRLEKIKEVLSLFWGPGDDDDKLLAIGIVNKFNIGLFLNRPFNTGPQSPVGQNLAGKGGKNIVPGNSIAILYVFYSQSIREFPRADYLDTIVKHQQSHRRILKIAAMD